MWVVLMAIGMGEPDLACRAKRGRVAGLSLGWCGIYSSALTEGDFVQGTLQKSVNIFACLSLCVYMYVWGEGATSL